MDDKSLLQKYSLMISFMLPEGMLDCFEVTKIVETDNDNPCHELDVLYPKVLNVYLKERDNREGEELGLVPNGFYRAYGDPRLSCAQPQAGSSCPAPTLS